MDQHINNQQYQFLAHLLSNPADGGQAYVSELQQLVKSFPQSGMLQALLSQALNERETPAAALYFDPHALHILVNNPAALPKVEQQQIYYQPETAGSAVKEPQLTEPEVIPADETPVDEAEITSDPSHQPSALYVEPHEEQAQANDIVIETQPAVVTAHAPDTVAIEDEVYEEIVGIENITIGVKQPDVEQPYSDYKDPFSAEETQHLINEQVADENTKSDAPAESTFRFNNEEEKLIVGNIAATDYFMFDKAFGKIEESAPEPVNEAVVSQPDAETAIDNKKYVSRYHDEQMPYTFLWWLDKTRREHSGIYRPYSKYTPEQQAIVAEKMAAADALQQQYIENIFHLSSVESLDKNTAENPAAEVKHKGDEIIERFIKEEPQIKPPSSDKLDNENKAKKSSEDTSELVSETLANIYADQMLYHKAIVIYRKLMLKFPEKSRYFADRIERLEKKTS